MTTPLPRKVEDEKIYETLQVVQNIRHLLLTFSCDLLQARLLSREGENKIRQVGRKINLGEAGGSYSEI